MKSLKHMLQSLNNSCYLMTNSIRCYNKNLRYKFSLLKNGLIMRDELFNQWQNKSTCWAIQKGKIMRNQNSINDSNRLSFLHNDNFHQTLKLLYKTFEINPTNSILLKTISDNISSSIYEEDIFHCSDKTLLVSEYFVPAENGLSRYYNLQRERKIWWMRFSANASRYVIEPFTFSVKNTPEDNLHEKVKSITIKANFPFGLVDMEEISLIPLWELNTLDVPCDKHFKVCLIRSVINLELTSCALILDACDNSRENGNNIMMLNRKLAPYQILIASLHQGNKIVDELATHLEHVIAKIGLRLYGKFVHINNQLELENELMHCDSLGVPYVLIVDNDSIKTGLINLRSRDTTLFETIHISDIPNYISHIFKA